VIPPGKLVRARAPLRLGLAGGGTDLSPYCDEHGGAVLNCTIDRYAYCSIEHAPDDAIHLCAHDLGIAERLPRERSALGRARLGLHAGVYRRMTQQFAGGDLPALKITSHVDAPPGSGLGSSSALVVAMVEAWRTWLGLPLGPHDVARLAFEIERIDLKQAGGRQDQYAAAFGGANFIEFPSADRTIVEPLRIDRFVMREFEASLVTCFTGLSRDSQAIIAEQQRNMTSDARALASLHDLKRDAIEMRQALRRGDIRLVAEILNRSWHAKKQTARDVSNGHIEALRAAALARGAIAGKVSGAGGGGFLMFIVPPQHRAALILSLNEMKASARAVHFTETGAESWVADGFD
jgi:D-glycero-alpha-D-manno-heptose-7-phosphate kinase